MSAGNALRNDDFRKLMSTPAPNRSSGPNFSTVQAKSHGFTHKQAKSGDQKPKKKYRPPVNKTAKEQTETDKLYNESDAKLHEIMKQYRDRAAERRKGEVDGQDIELRDKLTSGLRAFRDDDEKLAASDRREQEIRDSQFLGGDLEHTHLVKGLDYSLLNKARSEIKAKDVVVEEQQDFSKAFENPVSKHALLNKSSTSTFSRSITRILFETAPPIKNDLFQTKRMAYIVELDDEQAEVPVTLLRSTFECAAEKSEQNMNANNMLINKLSDVLCYLRSDGKKKRKEGAAKETAAVSSSKNDSIYDNVTDYVPNRDSKSSRSDREKATDRRNYFDEKTESRKTRVRSRSRSKERRRERSREREERPRDDRPKNRAERRAEAAKKAAPKAEHNPFPQTSTAFGALPVEEPKPKKSRLDQDDAYGELFPSNEMYYGGSDEDEEADFSKMDMGNKKGPINRFDFDNQEDYEKYMDTREANPKAAFQFGVKTGGGRKTRKNQNVQNEKKLDREYEKIEKIWKDGNSKTKHNY